VVGRGSWFRGVWGDGPARSARERTRPKMPSRPQPLGHTWRDSATRDGRLAVDLFHHRGSTTGSATPRSRAAGRVQLDYPGRVGAATARAGVARQRLVPGMVDLQSTSSAAGRGCRVRDTARLGGKVECNSTIPGGWERRRLGPAWRDSDSSPGWSTCSRPLRHRGGAAGAGTLRAWAAGRVQLDYPGRVGATGGRAGAARQRHASPGWSTCSRPLRHRGGAAGAGTPRSLGRRVECNSTIPGGWGRRRLGPAWRGSDSSPGWSTCSRPLRHRGGAAGSGTLRAWAVRSSATRPSRAVGRRRLGPAWRGSDSSPGWSTCSRPLHGITPGSASLQPRRRVECNSTIPGRPREVMRDKPTAGATRSGLFICAAQTENAG
jgi:hypothetical protein